MNNLIWLIGKVKDIQTINNSIIKVWVTLQGSDNISIPFYANGSMSNHVFETVVVGNLIALKGRLEEDKDNEIKIVAEKITYLSCEN